MSSPTIVSGGGSGEAVMFDQSVLDQGLQYPAAMAGLPTSTPNLANTRRRSRRSWFETTPKGFKFDIAVEKPKVKKPVSDKSQTVEVLTLTHFSAAPRLGFGTLKPGQQRTCTLLLRNPHDYEQTVNVEKVPEKKHFSVPCREFVVGPEESYPLEITWSPQEAGGVREMVMMQVDNSYRVQAYVFGTVTAPPPPKKKTGKRTGLLASKVSRPFSVIHTSSLANINHQYSPEKKTNKPSVPSKAKGPALNTHSRGTTNQTRGRRSNEARRRSDRHSGQLLADKNSIEVKHCEQRNVENEDPSKTVRRRSSGQPSGIIKPEDVQIPRKKMRRSNTYSNVSVGLIVPIIHNEEVKGHTDTSLLQNIEDCNISGIQALTKSSDKNVVDELPSFLETNAVLDTVENKALEPSFLVEEQMIEPSVSVQTSCRHVEKHDTEQASFLNTSQEKYPHASFLVPHKKIKSVDTFQDSLDMIENDENMKPQDEPSFLLAEDIEPIKPRRSLRKRSGQLLAMDEDQIGVKLLRSSVRNQDKPSTKWERSKNEVAGQSPILTQLKSLRSFIHDKSIEIETKESENENCRSVERRETFLKCRTSPRFSMPANEDLRRGTFVVDSAKLKLLETQKPSEASPRRTTFTVLKNNTRTQLNSDSRLVANHALIEEDEASPRTDVDAAIRENQMEVERTDKSSEQHVSNRLYSADSLENDTFEKQTCSADSLENDSFEKQTSSPQPIQVEPADEFSRRNTLTVTKSRPSDALLEHAQKQGRVSAALFQSLPSHRIDCIDEKQSLNDTGGHKSQNSTFEVSAERSFLVKESGFQATPNHLPTSPNPNHSRRSTHVVANPRVVSLGTVQGKQLFNENKADQVKDNKYDMTDSSVCKPVIECVENVEETELLSPPSANTRRRTLSARRSITGANRLSGANETEKLVKLDGSGSAASGDSNSTSVKDEETNKQEPVIEKLLFIPLDQPSSKTERKSIVKPDPKHFLKKRSNPLAQEVDVRTKRICSDVNMPPVNKTNTTRPVTRQIVKSTESLGVKTCRPTVSRQPQKPKASRVTGLAHSKLILTKKSKSAIPKHPLPFAAKNMFYDERWMEKQERGFVNWLNFILTPAEEVKGCDVKVKVDAGKLTVDVEKGRGKLAPTNEILSFRTYSAHRKLNRLRKSACRLFQSDAVRQVMHKLEKEVESGRLLVRRDKMIHADLGAKQRVLDMLLSYNPLWLRVGLETIYGEMVPLQCNTDVYGLSRFLITRLLSSPDIAHEYAHPTVPHLYRDGYAEASAQHTLKKFLMIVYFLDQAKQQRLIDHNPCLFCKNTDVKASKDLLLQLSRDYLSGEGDITRHLGYLGYKVTYTQTALDEFDFAVKNLATELRDGVRLTRVMEMLCGRMDLSRTLRMPAISKLQKLHNVKLVFQALTDQHVPHDGVTVHDIVEGHREKTLRLLWSVILHYQVSVLINLNQLKEEVHLLERSLHVKHQLHRLANLHADVVSDRRDSQGGDLHTQDDRLNLLLKWCRAVCAHFNIQIENFTVSFSDGRVLCHILHYYHPGLLPLAEIHNETMLTHVDKMENKCAQDSAASFNDSINSSTMFGEIEDPALVKQLLANEKDNFKVLAEKVGELGGIPMMLHWSDMSNTIPDEKVVVTYLLYLCARLLDIRHESRAARVIQHAWRAYRLKRIQLEYKEKTQAVIVLQRAVRNFLSRRQASRRVAAAVCIQRMWRGHQARSRVHRLWYELGMQKQLAAITMIQKSVQCYLGRQRYQRMKAAVIRVQACCRGYLVRRRLNMAATNIQRVYRGFCVRKHVQQMTTAATAIQAHVRGYQARKYFRSCDQAARVIQCRYRARLAMQQQICEYQRTRQSCVRIQLYWRQYVTRRDRRRQSAAVKIQSYVRCFLAQCRYNKLRASVVKVQAVIRGQQERNRIRKLNTAAMLIQRRYRDYVVTKLQRQQFLNLQSTAIFLQSQRRMIVQRQEYLKVMSAVIKLQASVRMIIQCRKFKQIRESAVNIQRHYRARLAGLQCRREYLITLGAVLFMQAQQKMLIQRRQFLTMKTAAVQIQASVRMMMNRSQFVKMQAAAVTIQRHLHATLAGNQCRRDYLITRGAIIFVQSYRKMLVQRNTYLHMRAAAITIQANVRMMINRSRFVKMRAAAVTIQSIVRCRRVRKAYKVVLQSSHEAATTIQAVYRGQVVRREFLQKRRAAVLIQACYRQHKQQQQYWKLKHAAIVCQRRYRAKLAGHSVREQYMCTRNAAIVLQTAFRAHTCRRDYLQLRNNVINMQALVRMNRARKHYILQRQAVTTVQQWYRSTVVARDVRQEFLIKVGAAITIQAAYKSYVIRCMYVRVLAARKIQSVYRMYVCRRQYLDTTHKLVICQSAVRRYLAIRRMAELQQQHRAASMIQMQWRARHAGRQQWEKYLKQRLAAVTIQRHLRATLARNQCRRDYLITRGAIIFIQSYRKMVVQRNTYLHIRAAAITIQANVRMMINRSRFVKMRAAAVTIQSIVRCRRVRKAYKIVLQSSHEAATTIQAVYRGQVVRKEFLKQKQAAVTIQSWYRGHYQRRQYTNLRRAVCQCQRKDRAKLLCRVSLEQYNRLKSAAVTLQSVYRGHQCRLQFVKLQTATVKIQSLVKMRIVRNQYVKQKSAALTIQQWYRGTVTTRNDRHKLLVKIGAAITIQSAYKSYVIRSLYLKVLAARKIQSAYRMYIARKSYLSTRVHVIKCQSAVRRFLAMRKFEKARRQYCAAVTIQQRWRAKQIGQVQRNIYSKYRQAVLVIQAYVKARQVGSKCRREYLVQKGAVITIQAAYRSHLARKQLHNETTAATKIQAAYRCYTAAQRYRSLLNTAVTCQRLVRAKQLGQTDRNKYQQLKAAAITVQSQFRMLKCQRSYMQYQKSAVCIQTWFRGVRDQRVYARWRHAACVLQERWRAELLCRQHVMMYHRLRDAAIAVQSCYRGRMASQQVARIRAAVTLQTYCRMMLARRRYLTVQRAAVRLQGCVLVWQARRRLQQLREEKQQLRHAHLCRVAMVTRVNMCAIRIQRCYRKHHMMKLARERLHSVLTIQRWVRSRLQRSKYLRDKERLVQLQARVRTWLARRNKAACVVQRAVRVWIWTLGDKKQTRAAITLQRVWRGYCVRRNSKSKKLAAARARVMEATASATEEKKLGNRTTSALDFLLKYKQLSQVLEALMHLDVATRLSWVCCERMVETNAITVLYRLLRGCNRSIPHMELIKYTISIMLNLAKYDKTRPSLYEEETGLNTLLELMQIYREKGAIFNRTCTLLGILALDTPCKTSIVEDKKFVAKLTSIQTLTARKHKLEETQRVTRARMNATFNTTFVVRSPVKKPKIKPDWSLHKDKMCEIENPLKAINFVLTNLGMPTKTGNK